MERRVEGFDVMKKSCIIPNFGIISILCALLLFHAVCNYAWLKQDNTPLWFDFGLYFDRSIQIFHAIQSNFYSFIKALTGVNEFAGSYHPYRVMLPLISVPFYFIFGLSEHTAVMTMMIFFGILLFSIYGIGKILFNPAAGLLSSFIVSFYPLTYWFSRHYAPEFVVMAIAALSVYLLIKSDNFENRIYSILFGVSFSVGLLSKEHFAVFLIGPLSYTVYKIFRNENSPLPPFAKGGRLKKYAATNLFLSFYLCAIIISIWYMPNLARILGRIIRVAFSEKVRIANEFPPVFSWKGVTFYFINSIQGISLFYSVSLLGSLVIHYVKRKTGRYEYKMDGLRFLSLWIGISYCILTTAPDKSIDYFIPAFPVFALITSSGMLLLKNKLLKITAVSALLSIGALQFSSVSFPELNIMPAYRENYRWALHKKNQDWKIKEILRYIEQYAHETGKHHSLVAIVPNKHEISVDVCIYNARMLNLNFDFLKGENFTDERIEYFLANADFIILKEGSDQGFFVSESDSKIILTKISVAHFFKKLPSEFELPDKTKVVIYMRK